MRRTITEPESQAPATRLGSGASTRKPGDRAGAALAAQESRKQMMAVAENIELRGELRLNEPMSRHTSWRAGGCADRWYQPADLDDLAMFMSELSVDEYVIWVGLGSNLLVRDGGVRGTVISTFGGLMDLQMSADGVIFAGAGVPCARLAKFAATHGLYGGEYLAGIPGCVGGALAMNAGAFGGETWPHVRTVQTLDRHGQVHVRQSFEYVVGYRSVAGPEGEWFTGAQFEFSRNPSGSESGIRELLERRNRTQPAGKASCGSVFRNPKGDYAARLIEESGLKGMRIGGAQVSEKHANFIINDANATATDIESLIVAVQTQVAERHDVRLVPEVRIVGEAGK